MAMAALGRLSGAKADNESNKTFRDVPDGAWYGGYLAWAEKNEIITGDGNGNFNPDAPVTREELAAMFCRFAISRGLDSAVAGNTDLSVYSDGKAISPWAVSAMKWAVGAGIIKGSSGAVNSKGTTTRAQAAQMLCNYLNLETEG